MWYVNTVVLRWTEMLKVMALASYINNRNKKYL